MVNILELEESVADLTRSEADIDKDAGRKLLAELDLTVAKLNRPERELRVLRLLGQANSLLDEAIDFASGDGVKPGKPKRHIAGIVTLFSGGNDSTTLAHMFRNRVTHIGVANTGIGIEQTRQYVRDPVGVQKNPACARWGWAAIRSEMGCDCRVA